jgi:hypothetical protein
MDQVANQQPFAKGVKEIHSMIDPMIALHPKSTSQLDKRIWHISEIRNKQKAYSGNGYRQKQILDASLPWPQMNELEICLQASYAVSASREWCLNLQKRIHTLCCLQASYAVSTSIEWCLNLQ